MTEYELEDIAGTLIPFRNLSILSIGPMKRLVWQQDANGNVRNHSLIVEDGSSLTASQLKGILDSEIQSIIAKYPDEEFANKQRIKLFTQAAYGRFFIGANMTDTNRSTVKTKPSETHVGLMSRSQPKS